MINLLKKDLIACFKTDIKIISKLILGITIISVILFSISSIVIPLFISYIFIFRSFQLDEMNKCDYFFNSLPIEKEDIVYSKYLFGTLIIIISIIFTFIYSNTMENFWGFNNFKIYNILFVLSITILLMSILFPLIFKYGYKKSYLSINLIVITTITTSINIFNDNKFVSENNNLYISLILSIILYLISMYISKRIYLKREIAN